MIWGSWTNTSGREDYLLCQVGTWSKFLIPYPWLYSPIKCSLNVSILRYFVSLDVKDNSDVVQDIARIYTCEMALRNMNLVILGPTESSDTTFTYTQNSSPQTSHSTLVEIIISLLWYATQAKNAVLMVLSKFISGIHLINLLGSG